ncbi:MAG: winged helix-turn-helix domain-containing protein [Polyangiaceae bacterium]|nr:winged helix-turn-helix domain-containing protein [Polyangiaceae bacterium]
MASAAASMAARACRPVVVTFQRCVRRSLSRIPWVGYSRPTWTRALLLAVVQEKTGTRFSLTTMTRVLQRIGARRGRPKPVVKCPLSERQQRRRLAVIRLLIANLLADEVAVYEDEADIHLNPKIGSDWMPRGLQKEVVTPGKNQKAYLAGTLDARDGTVLWVGAEKKNSGLFCSPGFRSRRVTGARRRSGTRFRPRAGHPRIPPRCRSSGRTPGDAR